MKNKENGGTGNESRLRKAGQWFCLAMAESMLLVSRLQGIADGKKLISDAILSITESTSDASTLTEPVTDQAASLATIRKPAVNTEATLASLSKPARSSGFLSFVILLVIHISTMRHEPVLMVLTLASKGFSLPCTNQSGYQLWNNGFIQKGSLNGRHCPSGWARRSASTIQGSRVKPKTHVGATYMDVFNIRTIRQFHRRLPGNDTIAACVQRGGGNRWCVRHMLKK